MWQRIREFFGRIAAAIGYILGQRPNIQQDSQLQTPTRTTPTEPAESDKELALPILTSRYERIDWENNPPRYQRKKAILSYREKQFYRILVHLLGKEYQILSMVRMADVMYLPKDFVDERKFHNINISSKHFDFVICDRLDFAPMLVIELDDPTHLYYHRKQVDDFKDMACEVAGLPIMRVPVQHTYDEEMLKGKILGKLSTIEEENA